MILIWDSCVNLMLPVYFQTQIVYVTKKQFYLIGEKEITGQPSCVVGDQIGQLKLEGTFNKSSCVGKKQNMGFILFWNLEESVDQLKDI